MTAKPVRGAYYKDSFHALEEDAMDDAHEAAGKIKALNGNPKSLIRSVNRRKIGDGQGETSEETVDLILRIWGVE